ncbi:MAG: murein L,D-transpeptidase catalytic domain family protein [Syntrophobacter sp.]
MNRVFRALLFTLVVAQFLVLVQCSRVPWPDRGPDRCLEATSKYVPPVPSQPAADRILASEAYRIALRYLDLHGAEFSNRKYICIIDYTKPSFKRRLFLIDSESGSVEKYFVSHARKSGWAYATRFSNSPGSLQSSKGFFKTGNVYCGKLGPTLELHGLEKGVNDNALVRKIVMHGAWYSNPKSIVINHWRLGWSQGCPALPEEAAQEVIYKIKEGGLLYIHTRKDVI